jgi:hypothetical protein
MTVIVEAHLPPAALRQRMNASRRRPAPSTTAFTFATTRLESDVSHKYYAPRVGIIKDDEFELAERPSR